jgi:AraC family transcriptional regulator of adaptative response / DNA-3-methyladenine glycosylase II
VPSSLEPGRESAGIASGLVLRLTYRRPYDAQAMLRFLAARAIPGVEQITWAPGAGEEPGSGPGTVPEVAGYTRAVPGGTITLVPAGDHIRLIVRTSQTRRLARIVSRCRRLLDLDADPEAVVTVLGSTALAPLVAARPGLRVPGAFDGFEMAVRAVVGQQISVAGARTILGRVAARAGTPADSTAPDGPDGGVALLFPDAGRLAGADLGGLGLTTRRTATLTALARAVADGTIDLDGAHDPAQTTAALLTIPGIGPWTASYIALRSLRDPDAWPAGDLVLKKTMARLGIPPGEAERWRPWRAYAALHLWNA